MSNIKRRAPQGIEAALAKRPRARKWLSAELRTTRTLASISAALKRTHGITASVQTLSDYLRRHAAEIFGQAQAQALALTRGQYVLTIDAPGAEHVTATLAPFTPRPAAPRRRRKASR